MKGDGDRKYIIIDFTRIEFTVMIFDITNKVNNINKAIVANLTKNNLIAFLNISISNSSSAPIHINIIGDKGSVKKDIILLYVDAKFELSIFSPKLNKAPIIPNIRLIIIGLLNIDFIICLVLCLFPDIKVNPVVTTVKTNILFTYPFVLFEINYLFL